MLLFKILLGCAAVIMLFEIVLVLALCRAAAYDPSESEETE